LLNVNIIFIVDQLGAGVKPLWSVTINTCVLLWCRADEDAAAEAGSSWSHQVPEQWTVRSGREEETGRRRRSTSFV